MPGMVSSSCKLKGVGWAETPKDLLILSLAQFRSKGVDSVPILPQCNALGVEWYGMGV